MVDRRRFARSNCCIAGCHRWSTLFPGEWMCADHWRMVPRAWRRALRRAWDRADKGREAWVASGGAFLRGGGIDLTRGDERKWKTWFNAHYAASRLWGRARRHVTFKAAGI